MPGLGMKTPIVEYIGAYLETIIGEITTDSGWEYTLSPTRSKRFFLENDSLPDLKAYILQGKSKTDGDSLSATAPRTVKQQYFIWVICLQSDDDVVAIDTKLNKVRSDVEKKLCENYTCDGYAKSLDIIDTEPTDDPETGILIEIEVIYMVQWNNPYTAK